MAIISTGPLDLNVTKISLEGWFATGVRGLVDPEVVTLCPTGEHTGYSSETLFVTVHHGKGVRHADAFVLRLPPVGRGLFETYDMGWQFRLMRGLRAGGHVLAPECPWVELDHSVLGRPFLVMSRVEGQTPQDAPLPYSVAGWVAEADDAQRARLWWSSVESLAVLSRCDWRNAGLDFMDWPDRTRSRTLQQIDLCDGVRMRGSSRLPDIDIPAIREAGRWLRANVPKNEVAGIVWGDARLGNFIYRDFQPAAHLDWEWAIIGDPLNDLAYFLMMDLFFRLRTDEPPVPRLAGFGDDAETVDRYAKLTGRSVDCFDYFWVLNAYKVYALSVRFASLHLHHGLMSVEEASRYRTCSNLSPHVMARISKC